MLFLFVFLELRFIFLKYIVICLKVKLKDIRERERENIIIMKYKLNMEYLMFFERKMGGLIIKLIFGLLIGEEVVFFKELL